MKRADLLAVKKRETYGNLHGVMAVYVIPSRRKHSSGWACMDFVAQKKGGEMVGCGGCCDDINLEGCHFRIDCDFESKVIRIWNSLGEFTVSPDASSMWLEEGK